MSIKQLVFFSLLASLSGCTVEVSHPEDESGLDAEQSAEQSDTADQAPPTANRTAENPGRSERDATQTPTATGDADAPQPAPLPKPAAMTLPSALVGSWYAGRGHTSEPYDPVTNTYGTPSGDGLLYTFKADGTYNKAFRSVISNLDCETGYTAFEAGVAQVQGSSLVTIPITGTLSYRDSCAPSLDSDKPLTDLQSETFTFERNRDGLLLVRADGASSQFRATDADE